MSAFLRALVVLSLLITCKFGWCGENPPKDSVVKAGTVTVSWEFKTSTHSGLNEVEVPETDVVLVVGERKVMVGRFQGFPAEVTDLAKAKFPEDAFIGCKLWFAGAGEDIYASVKKQARIEVFARPLDESERTLRPFKKVKEIRVPNKAEILRGAPVITK